MRIHLGAVLVLILLSPAVRSQDKGKSPESFLSADAVFYVHFDGIDAHRAAYEKTALAKVMKEDLGDFIEYAGPQLFETLFGGGPFGFRGGPNRRLEKARVEFATAAACVAKNGIALAIEVPEKGGAKFKGRRDLFHIEGAQATVVFPQGALAKNKAQLVPFFLAMAGVGELEVTERKARQRNVQFVDGGDFRAIWWDEGDHLVLTLGWLPIERTLDVIDGKSPNVATLPV